MDSQRRPGDTATRNGEAAHRAGLPITDNPWDEDRQPLEHALWKGGWLDAFHTARLASLAPRRGGVGRPRRNGG
jgi:hypothetical protein